MSTAVYGRAVAQFDPSTLVYHIFIVFLATVVLAFIFRFPRALGRCWRLAEVTHGQFLTYKPYASTFVSENPHAGPGSEGYYDQSYWMGSDWSDPSRDNKFAAIASEVKRGKGVYPPRIEPVPPPLRHVAALFRTRVAPGFSAMQVCVCAIWLSAILYAAIYRSPGPFTDQNRYGYIAVSQLPIIFGFVSKTNVFGMLFGMGYEKLNFLHRFVARVTVIVAHIHGLDYVIKWCIADTFREEIREPTNVYGLAMLLCFDGLFLLSMSFVRKNAYNLFFYSHVLLVVGLLFSLFHHYKPPDRYFYSTAAIYAADKILRIAKTRVTRATVRPIPELGLTRVEMRYINRGWRAGQHVRVQVLSSAMGLSGWAEIHPFTIASISGSPEGLVLLCKKTGTWTHNLFSAATTGRTEAGVGRNVQVVVEGPYGGPGFTMFNSFSAALFVAGGSGITFALSAIQELIQQDLENESRVRVIELIWIIQDASSLTPLIPQFLEMLQPSMYARLSIAVHYTKALIGNKDVPGLGTDPRLSLSPGRPRFINSIESVISSAMNTPGGDTCGLIVGVCGPVALTDDVSLSVGLVDPALMKRINGIQIHEEVFGW